MLLHKLLTLHLTLDYTTLTNLQSGTESDAQEKLVDTRKIFRCAERERLEQLVLGCRFASQAQHQPHVSLGRNMLPGAVV